MIDVSRNPAQDQHLVKTERPDENLQLKNENISDQSSQNNSENRLPNWNSNSNGTYSNGLCNF